MNEHPTLRNDTPAWIFQVWAAFIAALLLIGWGILNLPLDDWSRAYLLMGILFLVSSSFTLAKTLRDGQETRRLVNRVNEIKTEKLIVDSEMKR
ncbi:MAG: hypothetical protein H7095_02720 [Pseudopedobacter sp.]|nr:hypothetical protein [Deinococcales bacterium]